MANPLKDWGLKKAKAEEPRRNLPLQKAPEWVEDRKLWRALLSKALDGNSPPNLKGKFFHWDGTLYEAVSQENISDQVLIRDLMRKYPVSEKRSFFWVYLDEIDTRLALILGRR